jgi:hypothetical protein
MFAAGSSEANQPPEQKNNEAQQNYQQPNYQQPNYQQPNYPQTNYPQPNYQQPYNPQNGYGQMPGMPPKNDGMAIAALVLGIISVCGSFIPAVLAIIFGFISRNKINNSGGALKGSGMSLAGIILGFIGIVTTIIAIIALISIISSPGYLNSLQDASNTNYDMIHQLWSLIH